MKHTFTYFADFRKSSSTVQEYFSHNFSYNGTILFSIIVVTIVVFNPSGVKVIYWLDLSEVVVNISYLYKLFARSIIMIGSVNYVWSLKVPLVVHLDCYRTNENTIHQRVRTVIWKLTVPYVNNFWRMHNKMLYWWHHKG